MSLSKPTNYMFTMHGWVRAPTAADEQITLWREEACNKNNLTGKKEYFYYNHPELLINGNRSKYEILFNRNCQINYERISICNELAWHDVRSGVEAPTEPGTWGYYPPGHSI